MKITVTGKTILIDLLKASFREASRSTLKKWIQHGLVTVNGIMISRTTHPLEPGDQVEYHKYHGEPEEPTLSFRILFEDDALIAVEKPPGMLSYGVKGSEGSSVYRELLEYARAKTMGKGKVYVVHRLDREVSGVLLFTRSEKWQEVIKESWKTADKRYYALVVGTPPRKEGEVKSWLKENKAQRVYSVRESPDARLAITRYRVKKEIEGHTLLEIRLETGRKHQIRVQMADLGCPVAGDPKYSQGAESYGRIRLHAFYLSVIHPVTGKRVEFESQMPAGFLRIR